MFVCSDFSFSFSALTGTSVTHTVELSLIDYLNFYLDMFFAHVNVRVSICRPHCTFTQSVITFVSFKKYIVSGVPIITKNKTMLMMKTTHTNTLICTSTCCVICAFSVICWSLQHLHHAVDNIFGIEESQRVTQRVVRGLGADNTSNTYMWIAHGSRCCTARSHAAAGHMIEKVL